jgi:hypothetical protein
MPYASHSSLTNFLILTFRTIFVHNMFYPCSAKRSASDKDLPVTKKKVKGILNGQGWRTKFKVLEV